MGENGGFVFICADYVVGPDLTEYQNSWGFILFYFIFILFFLFIIILWLLYYKNVLFFFGFFFGF